jgi:hypothetical protein
MKSNLLTYRELLRIKDRTSPAIQQIERVSFPTSPISPFRLTLLVGPQSNLSWKRTLST